MPRSAEKTRRQILDGAYVLFRRRGYSRVTMDDIAAETRCTKRTLYNHFRSKDELLADVLAAQHELAVKAFDTFGDRLSGSPEAIVRGMFRQLAAWADTPRWAGSGFTRLVIELADLPGHPARLMARRHKARASPGADSPAQDLMSEEEFQSLYSAALRGGGPSPGERRPGAPGPTR